MTEHPTQFKVRIDVLVQQGIQKLKMRADEDAKKNNHKKSDIKTLVLGKLKALEQRGRLEAILGLDNPLPQIYSPPSIQDAKSVRFSIRVDDPSLLQAIIEMSDKAGRPKAQIVYNLIRYIAKTELEKQMQDNKKTA